MKIPEFISVAVAVWLAGCASTSNILGESTASLASETASQQGRGSMGDMCPMQVAGTKVTADDVEGGVALAFTNSSSSEVENLRQRVKSMAEMHNQHDCKMMTHGCMMPAATASVEEIAGGARIVLRPEDPAQLESLREHARMRAGQMARGECPMMSPCTEGQETPPPKS